MTSHCSRHQPHSKCLQRTHYGIRVSRRRKDEVSAQALAQLSVQRSEWQSVPLWVVWREVPSALPEPLPLLLLLLLLPLLLPSLLLRLRRACVCAELPEGPS